jgi:hypothetical protein
MTEHSAQRKTRRRFLADMLFLGGGLTAAGLLARAQLSPEKPTPTTAGQMMVPTPEASPRVKASPVPARPGEMVAPPPPSDIPPGAAGGMELPRPERSCDTPPPGQKTPSPGSSPNSSISVDIVSPPPEATIRGRIAVPRTEPNVAPGHGSSGQ